MGFLCGIVGLPNVGKSTLYNALTAGHAECSNYPFCTIEPNLGIVPLPDPRLDGLASIYRPEKVVPTTLEFIDIAGLVRGANKGEGLGNTFLSHIREVDAIAHVVRCFDDPAVIHVDGDVNPTRDIEIVETELLLKDLDAVERRLSEIIRHARSGDKKARLEAECWERLKHHLGGGRLARYAIPANNEEVQWRRELHLLTDKPVMYVCNVPESDVGRGNAYVESVRAHAGKESAPLVLVSAAIEAEIVGLSPADRKEFVDALGLSDSGLDRVVRSGYALLDLVTFFTVGTKEVHAWTVKRGTSVLAAAGKIHSDFERGFICAEVMKSDDLLRVGGEHHLRETGALRVEGRDYLVQDGDVILVRFNV